MASASMPTSDPLLVVLGRLLPTINELAAAAASLGEDGEHLRARVRAGLLELTFTAAEHACERRRLQAEVQALTQQLSSTPHSKTHTGTAACSASRVCASPEDDAAAPSHVSLLTDTGQRAGRRGGTALTAGHKRRADSSATTATTTTVSGGSRKKVRKRSSSSGSSRSSSSLQRAARLRMPSFSAPADDAGAEDDEEEEEGGEAEGEGQAQRDTQGRASDTTAPLSSVFCLTLPAQGRQEALTLPFHPWPSLLRTLTTITRAGCDWVEAHAPLVAFFPLPHATTAVPYILELHTRAAHVLCPHYGTGASPVLRLTMLDYTPACVRTTSGSGSGPGVVVVLETDDFNFPADACTQFFSPSSVSSSSGCDPLLPPSAALLYAPSAPTPSSSSSSSSAATDAGVVRPLCKACPHPPDLYRRVYGLNQPRTAPPTLLRALGLDSEEEQAGLLVVPPPPVRATAAPPAAAPPGARGDACRAGKRRIRSSSVAESATTTTGPPCSPTPSLASSRKEATGAGRSEQKPVTGAGAPGQAVIAGQAGARGMAEEGGPSHPPLPSAASSDVQVGLPVGRRLRLSLQHSLLIQQAMQLRDAAVPRLAPASSSLTLPEADEGTVGAAPAGSDPALARAGEAGGAVAMAVDASAGVAGTEQLHHVRDLETDNLSAMHVAVAGLGMCQMLVGQDTCTGHEDRDEGQEENKQKGQTAEGEKGRAAEEPPNDPVQPAVHISKPVPPLPPAPVPAPAPSPAIVPALAQAKAQAKAPARPSLPAAEVAARVANLVHLAKAGWGRSGASPIPPATTAKAAPSSSAAAGAHPTVSFTAPVSNSDTSPDCAGDPVLDTGTHARTGTVADTAAASGAGAEGGAGCTPTQLETGSLSRSEDAHTTRPSVFATQRQALALLEGVEGRMHVLSRQWAAYCGGVKRQVPVQQEAEAVAESGAARMGSKAKNISTTEAGHTRAYKAAMATVQSIAKLYGRYEPEDLPVQPAALWLQRTVTALDEGLAGHEDRAVHTDLPQCVHAAEIMSLRLGGGITAVLDRALDSAVEADGQPVPPPASAQTAAAAPTPAFAPVHTRVYMNGRARLGMVPGSSSASGGRTARREAFLQACRGCRDDSDLKQKARVRVDRQGDIHLDAPQGVKLPSGHAFWPIARLQGDIVPAPQTVEEYHTLRREDTENCSHDCLFLDTVVGEEDGDAGCDDSGRPLALLWSRTPQHLNPQPSAAAGSATSGAAAAASGRGLQQLLLQGLPVQAIFQWVEGSPNKPQVNVAPVLVRWGGGERHEEDEEGTSRLSMALYLCATRDIAPGEELVASYRLPLHILVVLLD